MDKIKRIETRDDLIALASELGMRPDWHEPDERGVRADVRGYSFDNAGFWGYAEVAREDSIGPAGLEMWVTLWQGDQPVAEVNLATLLAFACGYEG